MSEELKPSQRVLVRDAKPRNNLTGHRYGRLLVLGKPKKSLTNRMVSYLCQCDCGKVIRIIGSKLTSGHTTSCGCFHKEQLSQRNKTHGMSKTRLYRIWKRMKQRCYDKNVKEFHRYGGRGIGVCEQYYCLHNNYRQCIPYNDKTKHLLGRTGSPTPPEQEFQFGDKVEVRFNEGDNWMPAIFFNRIGDIYTAITRGSDKAYMYQFCRHADW